MSEQQHDKIRRGRGFIAALDQSGGSTPKALRNYGIADSEYSNDSEMFDKIHEMRSRIITSPSFGGDRIIGAILFENTMDRQVGGKNSVEYLWDDKQVVSFLKVDKGLAEESDGVRMMKPIPDLDALLQRGKEKGVVGTKMRSFITQPNPAGVEAIVEQQFEIGHTIIDAGLIPILEPEIDIHSPGKAEAEQLLRDGIRSRLDGLATDQKVMLKLTLPEEDDFYADLIAHPNVVRVAALSGGYTREEATDRLARQHGMIASFSRALTEGLEVGQSQEEFDKTLDQSIQSIFEASIT
jgi:fructose-bisphosphate aldolase class I